MAKKKLVEEQIIEKIVERPLGKAIHDYMMPYSEYIILDRALPRVEDGLKPVQRRILYAMNELSLKPDGAFKKSARVVGDCLGKYHPHGDTSIYFAMVNMAQEFNMRNTLVKGHGNFGSIDNDPPAAMRYTEVKLEPLACELLRDLDKDTVKWVKNFDDSLDEPDTLPGRFPNLLVNGTTGIAIGLATKIPPHNLTEVIDGVVAMIEKPKISIEEMLHIIKGPDFPTGAYIIPGDSLADIYTTGRGKIVMRAKVEIENTDNDRQNIVITELPYGVIKSDLLQRIKDLRESTSNKKDENGEKVQNILSGIQEIADESDRNGIRAVIRLKKGEDAIKIVNYLYQKTNLQCNFNVNMVAIADGKPQQLGLLSIINYYINYQREIIYKRTSYDLKLAKDREHILLGFSIILPAIDEVIALIKSSNSRTEAKDKLRKAFGLSEKQADAILDLRLVNLTKLEVTKIENELAELEKRIAEFERIVGSKNAQLEVVKKELIEIRDKYRSKRLTTIVENIEDIEHKPFDAAKNVGKRGYIVLGVNGDIKYLNPRQYLSANREEPNNINEIASEILYLDKGEKTIVFGSQGNAYKLDLDNMIEHKWTEKGELISSIIPSDAFGERCVNALTVTDDMLDKDIYIFTKLGMVKKSLVKDYIVNKACYQVVTLKENDEVINVELKRPDCSIMFITSDGLAVNSMVDEYPDQGRKAGGVIGAVLNDGCIVKYVGQVDNEYDDVQGEIVLINGNGYAKRVIASEIELSKRARKGIKVIDIGDGNIAYAGWVTEPYDIALVDGAERIYLVNTEDVLIDHNRLSKGKPFGKAKGCVQGFRHVSEI